MDQRLTEPAGGGPVDWRGLLSNLVRSLDERAWGITSPPSWAEVKAARAALAAEAVGDEEGPDVDHILRLAEIIRRVDGSHNLGAAALAEAILSHPGARAVLARYGHQPAPPALTADEFVLEALERLRHASISYRMNVYGEEEIRMYEERAARTLALCKPRPHQVASPDLLEHLAGWKESALAVEREWDANGIATMLGCKLGESQRACIQREVPRLLDQLRELEQRHPAPVPVSERLPGLEDCDAEGRCWLHLPDMGTEPLWRLTDPSMRSRHHSQWLSYPSLPLPDQE